jgi:hypothetical protein
MQARRALASIFVVPAMVLLGPVGAAGLPSPSPGTASGSLSIDGKSVELHYAYAMSQANRFDETKTDTAILLTDRPLPESGLSGLKDLEGAGSGELRNSVLFVIEEDGKAKREVIHHDSLKGTNLQMSGMTQADVKITARTADRIEGSAQTKKPEDFFEHKYQINVQFQAAIRAGRRDPPLPNATNGKKLPPDGGEPGKAYFAFKEAIRKKDVAAVRKAKPPDMPDLPDAELRQAMDAMAMMTPENLKIDSGYVAGDAAVLYVSGTLNGQRQYGTARLSKSGGAWRYAGEKWSDKPPTP